MSEQNKSDWVSPSVEECVALLKSGPEGVEKWNVMRNEHPEWKPDLSGQDFSGQKLAEVNFERAILDGACLDDATLIRANLRSVYLSGSSLERVNLFKANLEFATLFEANLLGADLTEANVSRASFIRADLTEANLIWANLTEALFAEARTIGVNWWCVNIAGAKGLKSTTVELILATIRDSLG